MPRYARGAFAGRFALAGRSLQRRILQINALVSDQIASKASNVEDKRGNAGLRYTASGVREPAAQLRNTAAQGHAASQ